MKTMIFLVFCLVTVPYIAPAVAETIQVFAKNHRVFAVYPNTNTPVWSDDGILYEDILADETMSTQTSDVSPDMFCPILVRHLRLYVILGTKQDVLVALDLRREGRLVWRISTESLGGGTFVLPMRIGAEKEDEDEDEVNFWEDVLTVSFQPATPLVEPKKLWIDVATGIVLPTNVYCKSGTN